MSRAVCWRSMRKLTRTDDPDTLALRLLGSLQKGHDRPVSPRRVERYQVVVWLAVRIGRDKAIDRGNARHIARGGRSRVPDRCIGAVGDDTPREIRVEC